MALTDKQRKVLDYCQSHEGKITKKEAMTLINTYYANGKKHVGDVLSRMVKAGLLIREKPGHFKMGKGTRNKPANEDKKQINIF